MTILLEGIVFEHDNIQKDSPSLFFTPVFYDSS